MKILLLIIAALTLSGRAFTLNYTDPKGQAVTVGFSKD